MKIEDNHYTYRIETKDSNGGSLDFIDIDTVEPLRCAYDVQDELNLETNEHIKRVEEIVLNANSTEFWYVDEARTSETHLVCYFEEVELMASKDHPMVDTNRSVFEYGKINSNEHQNTNFICTHVMDNGVSRIYMSIDKTIFEFATYNNETIKHFISNNPVTVWYALRYEVIIPRSLSKGHLLTLNGQTDITLTTNNEQAKLPIMKFNVGDTQYTLDTNPIHINNTQEGTQIRNIVLEGNTPINYARGNGVNTTEQESNTRYDFEPFYDGQATIQNTVEGGYVSAKLYGDTMVNIAKPYGETPLLTATSESTLCDDLLGTNEEGIVLADGEITEGRIVGDSFKGDPVPTFTGGNLSEGDGTVGGDVFGDNYVSEVHPVPNRAFTFTTSCQYSKVAYYDADMVFISCDINNNTTNPISSTPPNNAVYVRYGALSYGALDASRFTWIYNDNGKSVYTDGIQSVVNPTVYSVTENLFDYESFKTQEAVGNYVNIPIKLKKDTVYHIISDYNEWNGSFAYMCLAKVENGSYTNLLNLIDSNNPNTYGKGFATGNHDNYVIRAISTDRDIIISKATKIGIFEGKYSSHEIAPHKHTQATLPYTLNKLPNGVADYIDVVNKVYVQRVGIKKLNSLSGWYKLASGTTSEKYMCGIENPFTGLTTLNDGSALCDTLQIGTGYYGLYITQGVLCLAFPTKDLESASVSAWKKKLGELNPTVLYKLATPIYTPLTEEEIAQLPLSAYKDGYVNLSSDQLTPSFEFRMRASNRYQVDMLETGYYYLNAPTGNVKLGTASVDVQQMPCIVKVDNVGAGNSGYRLGFDGEITDTTQITLAKLPSHRIPTTFTQGMKCGTDFGYWEGVKESAWRGIRLTGETGDGSLRSADNLIRYLNRIEGNYQGQVVVEDEFDFATGKLTKRIGKVVVHNLTNVYDIKSIGKECTYISLSLDKLGIKCKNSFSNGAYGFAMSSVVPFKVDYNGEYAHMFTTTGDIKIIMKNSELGTLTQEGIVKYFEANPMTVYYELAVPEISYVDVLSHEGKAVNNETKLGTSYYLGRTYLNPQVKPSHLTYPVPSLVGNGTYTVVHNRKNITGSTKPIELNLGGTVVQLNDASSKTLVKTPSTLAHSNLIFIGGESTVDHIMVLDGDWTNKPIEYFENMMGHDTDAIITIIGNGQIDDVEEQYLW